MHHFQTLQWKSLYFDLNVTELPADMIVNESALVSYYIMAGHAIVVVKDMNLLFYHGNAVILTLL